MCCLASEGNVFQLPVITSVLSGKLKLFMEGLRKQINSCASVKYLNANIKYWFDKYCNIFLPKNAGSRFCRPSCSILTYTI